MEKELKIFGMIIIISLGALFLLVSNVAITGNVILNTGNYSKGEQFKGLIQIDFKDKENIASNSPIIFILSKNNSIVAVETMTFEEFAENFLNITKKQDDSFVFNSAKSYSVDAGKVLNYSFINSGDYTFIFSILEKDLLIQDDFYVEETFKKNTLLPN